MKRNKPLEILTALSLLFLGNGSELFASSEDQTAVTAKPSASPQPNQGNLPTGTSASLPLVFLDPDASVNPEIQTKWKLLRVTFLQDIGGISQTPADPQSIRNWERAKNHVEGELKKLIGEKMFAELKNNAKDQADLKVDMRSVK